MSEPGSDDTDRVERTEAAPGEDTSGEAETGSEVLLEEAREEVARLVRHPVAELRRLEHVADEGESAATPLIVAVGVIAVFAIILAVVLTVIMLVYYDA